MHCIAWVRIVPPNPRGDGNTEKYCPRPEYIHCKIANFGARQATLSDIARQATLALVAETKLLVYNVELKFSNDPGPLHLDVAKLPEGL